MAKKNTIRDVAQAAGVSLGTASRVINGSANVDPKLRESVERAILQIGFEPNAAARSIRNGSSKVVGIVISDITLERLAVFARSAQITLESAGYAVFIACHENRREREEEILKFLASHRVEGLIRCHSTSLKPEELAAIPKVPTVVYDRDAPEGVDTVRVLHGEGVRRATELLLELGHRRIALVTGPRQTYPGRSRIEGHKAAIEAAGIPYDPQLVSDASFSKSFLDVSLVAATDSDVARLVSPPITVVRWDSAEVGTTCAQVLLKRLQGNPEDHQHVKFLPELVVRSSCAAWSGRD
jgi:LacI family transcriptional regulator